MEVRLPKLGTIFLICSSHNDIRLSVVWSCNVNIVVDLCYTLLFKLQRHIFYLLSKIYIFRMWAFCFNVYEKIGVWSWISLDKSIRNFEIESVMFFSLVVFAMNEKRVYRRTFFLQTHTGLPSIEFSLTADCRHMV